MQLVERTTIEQELNELLEFTLRLECELEAIVESD